MRVITSNIIPIYFDQNVKDEVPFIANDKLICRMSRKSEVYFYVFLEFDTDVPFKLLPSNIYDRK